MIDCSLRIIFAGTPSFAAYHLAALIGSPNKVVIVGVFTQPDRPAGRGYQLKTSAVKQLALKHGLPVYQPSSLRSAEVQYQIKKFHADIMVVVAYGIILPSELLSLPRLGCINVHASLLPRWRGAAPIQNALLAGDVKTGVTIIQMDKGIDTGDILYQDFCDILPTDTSGTLQNRLATIGSIALLTTLDKLKKGNKLSTPQDKTKIKYITKLSKKEAQLNWNLSATHLERQVRAFNPWPISSFMVNEHRIKVWEACVLQKYHFSTPGTILLADNNGIQVATGEDILILKLLQLAGKRSMIIQELLHSRREWFIPGSILK